MSCSPLLADRPWSKGARVQDVDRIADVEALAVPAGTRGTGGRADGILNEV
jgi:hypothetical protein